MQMDEHTSAMVWMWTINELCRKVELTIPPTSELSQRAVTGVSLVTVIPA